MDRRMFLAASASGVLSGGAMAGAMTPAYPAPYRDPSESQDAFELLIGVGLIRVIKPPAWPAFRERIGGVRSDLAKEGLAMPALRIRDFIKLQPEDYLLLVNGEVVEHGVFPARQTGHVETRRRILERIAAIARRQGEWTARTEAAS